MNWLRKRRFPNINLLLHRLEIPLNPIDSDREHIDEAEMFRVLRQHRSKRAGDNVSESWIEPMTTSLLPQFARKYNPMDCLRVSRGAFHFPQADLWLWVGVTRRFDVQLNY